MLNFALKIAVSGLALILVSAPAKARACDIFGIAKGLDSKVKLTRASPNLTAPRTFNSSTKVLPKNYSGIDPYLTWTLLSKSQAEKGEFETTQEAEKRSNLETPYAIKHGFSTAHSLPFVKPISDADLLLGSALAYNADNQVLEFKLESRYSGDFRIVVNQNTQSDQYIGSNAFGVKAKVDRTYGCESAIEFKLPNALQRLNTSSFSYGSSSLGRSEIVIPIPATPEQAKSIKTQKLAVVYLLKPLAPYVKSDSIYNKPTISEPQQYLISTNIVFGRLNGILIFNRATGQVLASKFFEE